MFVAFEPTDSHFSNHIFDEDYPPPCSGTTPEIGGKDDIAGLEKNALVIGPSDPNDAGDGGSPHPNPQAPTTSTLTPDDVYPRMTSHGTPPINMVLTPSAARSRSRARSEHGENTLPDATPRPLPEVSKASRKKKRSAKKGTVAALSTVRGFTPATSGDEDSDFSAGSFCSRRDLTVQRSSSVVRKDFSLDRSTSSLGSPHEFRSSSPSTGISALSKQLEALDRESSPRPSLLRYRSKLGSEEPSSASVTSGTSGDEDALEYTSYEIPLEHDFVSPDVSEKEKREARQDPMLNGGVVRKMQAADFEPLRCLGKGTYGTVLLVKQAGTGKLYAQKHFRKASLTVRKQLVEQTKTERNILESINRHPFVVKLFYAFQDHEKLYLILEYAQGGELFERMRTERMFPEEVGLPCSCPAKAVF